MKFSCVIVSLAMAIATLNGCSRGPAHADMTEPAIMPERLKLVAVDTLDVGDRSNLSIHELASYGRYAMELGEHEMAVSFLEAAINQDSILDVDSQARLALLGVQAAFWSGHRRLAERSIEKLDTVRTIVQVNTPAERNWAFIASKRFNADAPIWAKPTGSLRSVFAKNGPRLKETRFTQGVGDQDYDESSLQATIALFVREKIEKGEAAEAYQAVLLHAQIMRLEQRIFLPLGELSEVNEDALMRSILGYII